MPKFACAACDAARVLCAKCAVATKSPFDGLPIWPDAAHAILPGAHQMMAGDDDEDEGGADEEEEEEEKSKGKKGKGKGDDDDDEGKFSEKQSAGGKKGKGKGDDDKDDDDRPKKKRRDGGAEDAAKGGMGIGMILGIVFVLLTCCLCLPGVMVALLMPAMVKVQEAAARTQAINNMKQIALACHSHHDVFKTLPSPRTRTAELSWRYDLLPYVDQQMMYQQINKDAAWDAPGNAAFMSRMPMVYNYPGEKGVIETSNTKFQYFTGPNTMFPDPKSQISLAKIQDGASNTFLFAEAAAPVPWLKPADMAVTPNGPIPVPQGRFLAGMADASVRVIDRGRVNDNTLRLLINPNDGQPIPPGAFDD